MCKMFFVICFVSLVSSPVITRAAIATNCGKYQKKCSDGSCRPIGSKCLEVLSYHNSSGEEYLSISPRHARSTRERRQLVASDQCVLPPYPRQGIYTVANVPDAKPGEIFESVVLTVSCRKGFGFDDSDVGVDSHGTQQIYCINGRWFQRIPKCIRYCKLNSHPSVRYTCHLPGNDFRSCKRYLPPGTAVRPTCNKPLYTSSRDLPFMRCISGYWDYIAECQAECGQVTSEAEQLIIDGRLAKKGELPWHVAIYKKDSDPYRQICGGSLVSNNVVISAAHCFWSDALKQLPASDYAVATGKLYRFWNEEKDVDAQKSDVKEIKLPVLFYGTSNNLQEDIATLILKTPFVYKNYVRPVCLHFDLDFERRQLQAGKFGKIAGFGLTGANGPSSPVLKVAKLPFIPLETCLNIVPKPFRAYLTVRNFCAGYTNGTALCRGDSGGGLAFAANTDLDIERYYLRGVVSAAPSTEDLCNANTFTTFTKISNHEEFIKDTLARADKTCPPYFFQCDDGNCVHAGADCNNVNDCADGSDESDALCKPGYEFVNRDESSKPGCTLPAIPAHGSYKVLDSPNAQPGQTLDSVELTVSCDKGFDLIHPYGIEWYDTLDVKCASGEWEQELPKCVMSCGRIPEEGNKWELPWHVGIYTKLPSYLLLCGGTLVSSKVVLSSATCFEQDKRISPTKYAVAAGKLHGRWDDTYDDNTQKSDVKEIKISNLSKASKSKIAAIYLVTPFFNTAYVRPACVNLELNFDEQDSSKLGKTATWPFDAAEQRAHKLYTMEAVELSQNLGTCNNFLQAAREDNICAAHTKDPRIFAVFAGSGLVYPQTDSGVEYYYLRGIMSNLLICGNGCIDSDYSYHVYTKLSDYKEFVRKAIS